jgi:hypothetical protein
MTLKIRDFLIVSCRPQNKNEPQLRLIFMGYLMTPPSSSILRRLIGLVIGEGRMGLGGFFNRSGLRFNGLRLAGSQGKGGRQSEQDQQIFKVGTHKKAGFEVWETESPRIHSFTSWLFTFPDAFSKIFNFFFSVLPRRHLAA